MAKIIIVLILITIAGALGSGLYFMMKDNTESDRLLKALTWRISLSLTLFVCLMAGYYFGWLEPNIR